MDIALFKSIFPEFATVDDSIITWHSQTVEDVNDEECKFYDKIVMYSVASSLNVSNGGTIGAVSSEEIGGELSVSYHVDSSTPISKYDFELKKLLGQCRKVGILIA